MASGRHAATLTCAPRGRTATQACAAGGARRPCTIRGIATPIVGVDYHGRPMRTHRNIFLIGPMGSGKTAVGRHLARLFRLTFHDSDADIEARTGVDISFIFEKEGEAGFRLREKESIERLTQLDSIVLATGGGAVIEADNRRVLAERGVVVYLSTSLDQQLERTRHGRHRPLLNDTDPERKLKELMSRRAALYAEIAQFTVSTDGRRVQLVAEEIHHELRRRHDL